jgi:hypothetical protein
MDSLGINLEGYFELSLIITGVVDLDADLRIMLNYLHRTMKTTEQIPNKWLIISMRLKKNVSLF